MAIVVPTSTVPGPYIVAYDTDWATDSCLAALFSVWFCEETSSQPLPCPGCLIPIATNDLLHFWLVQCLSGNHTHVDVGI